VGDNSIAQHSDPLDLEFDHVAGLDEAHMLQPFPTVPEPRNSPG
jgi:hypothetical protein